MCMMMLSKHQHQYRNLCLYLQHVLTPFPNTYALFLIEHYNLITTLMEYL
jgi:hypothetical protein